MSAGGASFPQIPEQFGLATREQLSLAGFTRSAVRHAAERDWRQVRPGVFAPHRGPLDADARLAAEHDIICLGITPRSIHRRPEATLRRTRAVVLRNVGRRYGPVRVGGEICGGL